MAEVLEIMHTARWTRARSPPGTTVGEAARHVLAVARIALGHHGGGLERRVGDL